MMGILAIPERDRLCHQWARSLGAYLPGKCPYLLGYGNGNLELDCEMSRELMESLRV